MLNLKKLYPWNIQNTSPTITVGRMVFKEGYMQIVQVNLYLIEKVSL